MQLWGARISFAFQLDFNLLAQKYNKIHWCEIDGRREIGFYSGYARHVSEPTQCDKIFLDGM
jgi:hypothetical protein